MASARTVLDNEGRSVKVTYRQGGNLVSVEGNAQFTEEQLHNLQESLSEARYDAFHYASPVTKPQKKED